MNDEDIRDAERARKQFSPILGEFYAFWSIAETTTSMGIGALLKLSDKNTHLLTARMEFSKKAALVRHLTSEKKHPNADKIKSALNKIQNESKRNSFAHSSVFWGKNSIYFVEKTWEGEYKARLHDYTLMEFKEHVQSFSRATKDLLGAFGFTRRRMFLFAAAAFKAQRKPSKSPKPPKRKA